MKKNMKKKTQITIQNLLKSKASSQHRYFGLFLAKKIEDSGYCSYDIFEKELVILEGAYSIGNISFGISKKEIQENELVWIFNILELGDKI